MEEKAPAVVSVSAAVSDLPDSPAPVAETTSSISPPVIETTVPVPAEIFTPAVVATTTAEPLPIVTTTVVEPEPVVTPEPVQFEWTVALAKQAGREIFGDRVFRQCVDPHVQAESGWNWLVYNFQGSGAYGLPQALPGSKMASAGADWKTNPRTQLLWYQQYVNDVYGSPCQAWAFFQANGWY